jgi:hypothetical protein
MNTPPITAPGYLKIKDMFDADPFAEGNQWYFDPTANGNATGRNPANAFKNAGQVNQAQFETGDQLVFRADTVTTLDKKIRNMRMVGEYQNPFYFGAYRMEAGGPVMGRGDAPRPIIQSLDADQYDPYGGMDNATLMSMIPTPAKNADGSFQQGSMEGLVNWYRNEAYDLMLMIDGVSFCRSGGRHLRFSQSKGGKAWGLYVKDSYFEGSMNQAVHLSGLYDAILEDIIETFTSVEFNYWEPPSNRQAALAVKGTKGDPDTPCNVWFVRPIIYDGWSSEAINSNSGNNSAAVVDGFTVDQGIYGLYDDRTPNMALQRNVLLRTSRKKFLDHTGVGKTSGRGVCGIEIQNESSHGSFPWDKYNTAEDFAKYRTHDSLVSENFVAGYSYAFGFQSQASTKAGEIHEGRPFGAGVYWYGNVSLAPFEAHYFFNAWKQSGYVIDTDNPPRFWAGVHLGNAPISTDKPAGIEDFFLGNYYDLPPPPAFANGAIVGGYEADDTVWIDTSYLMETDADGHMNEAQVLEFRDEIHRRLKPLKAPLSKILTRNFSNPPLYNMTDNNSVDFEGKPFGDVRHVGAFSLVPPEPPLQEIIERIEALEATTAAQSAAISVLHRSNTVHSDEIDLIFKRLEDAAKGLVGADNDG